MERHRCVTTGAESATPSLPSLVSTALTVLHYPHGGQRLMLAILLDAIEVIEGYGIGNRAVSWSECQAAVQWIYTCEEHWPFSFENICAALGLQTEKLRTLLSSEFPAVFFRATRGDTSHPKA